MRTILLADDDRDTRVILRTVLERQEFVVVEAATGDAAFEASQHTVPDLIILNYPMLHADGDTLVRHLREHPATHHVPILNLTSRVVPQYLKDAAEEGVTLTLSKPVDVALLLQVVSDMMSVPASRDHSLAS